MSIGCANGKPEHFPARSGARRIYKHSQANVNVNFNVKTTDPHRNRS